ncbi:hypothetical protein PVK06_031177 [Gossypium arboreum]|uniref:DUF4283 domain-containing protein n=1 Tax=Gossypium arboreum TaxID=29729 RepID=A0ABR0NQ96_GOSAR|nr:hypothetical protein PVK06_031177 [Gossypium arboreum]
MADVKGDFQGLSLEDVEEEEVVKLEKPISSTGESLENYLVRTFLASNVVDVDRIKVRGPWNFNSHLLILRRLHDEDDPKTIPLNTVDFWVLVEELRH